MNSRYCLTFKSTFQPEKPKKLENYFFYVKIFDWNYLHLTAQTKETYFNKINLCMLIFIQVRFTSFLDNWYVKTKVIINDLMSYLGKHFIIFFKIKKYVIFLIIVLKNKVTDEMIKWPENLNKSLWPSLNTQSCIRGLLVIRDFCFWAV